MSETLTLTKVHNAINRTDRDVVQWVYVPGQSLAVIRESLPTEVMFAVSLNGITVPEERFVEVFPCAGDHILFVPIIAGGSDGKAIGRIVGMIVIAIAAVYTGGLAAAAYGGYSSLAGVTAGILTSGAIMMVGGLMVNAILPPPKANASGVTAENSQAYGWNPQSVQQQGIPVPRWYGTNKLYGNIIGSYIGSNGDTQYLNALVGLGVGPFADIPVSEMRINDQPITNFITSPPIIEPKSGLLNQTAISNFQTTVVEHSLSQKVSVSNSPYVYTPSGVLYDGLEVEITFPQGLYEINQSTGAFENQTVEVKIEITNGTSTYNLSNEVTNVSLQSKVGWSLGKWVDIAPDATNPGAYVGKAWVETTDGENYMGNFNAAGTVLTPFHSEGVVLESGLMWHFFGKAVSWGFGGCYFAVQVAMISASEGSAFTSKITSNSNKVVRKIFKHFGLTYGTWDVKVTRITADNTSSTIINDVYLTAVRELVSIQFAYPRHAMVGIRSLATDTLSGSLRFSAVCACLNVRIWSGTAWSVGYNNNPAWVLFDVLTQPVYSGDGSEASPFAVIRYDGINPSRLDLVKFKEWADYCDELLPDGKGGTEKRITFNGGFDVETNLWDAAMTVCQVGGAILVWNGINLTLAIDKPSDPVQLFSVGNTGVDSFSEVFLSMEDRAAEIEVDFTNSENDYKRDKVTITNANIKTISSKVGLQMVGVTKSSEAWRIAKKRLLYNELITRTVSWKADIDAIACTVGDVVLLQADVPQWGQGGRLVSATTTQVVLDQPVTIAPSITYSIMVRIADDTLVERTISNAPGTTDTLTVTSAFTTAPAQYDVYAFGISNQESKPFRIISIQKSGDLEANLTAVEYNASIYDDTGDPVLPVVNYSTLPAWPTFSGLVLTEDVAKVNGGGVDNKISVIYDFVSDTASWPKVELLVSEAGAAFVSKGVFVTNESISFSVSPNITYRVVVRAVNAIGEFQPMSSGISATLITVGQDTPPANVASFTATFAGNLFKLAWTPNTEFDLAGYEIRTGASWVAGTILQAAWLGNTYTYRPTASGAVTFWIKAFDTSGNESLVASTASATVPVADVPTSIVPVSQFLEIDLDITFDTTRQDTLQVEIHAATTNNRSVASQVGTSKEKRWKHRNLNNGDTWYYWTRIDTVFGETGSWYPSGVNSGVVGSALNDPKTMVQLMNPDITDASVVSYLADSTSLLKLLDTRSMLFELGVVGPGVTATYTDALAQAASQMNANQTLLQSLNSIVAGLVVTEYDNATAYTVGMIVDYLGQTYQCILPSTGNLPTNTTYWSPISGLYDLVNAIQQNLDTLSGTFTSTAATLTADIADLANPTDGRVTLAETTISQHGTDITLQGTAITGPLAFVVGAVTEPGVVVETAEDVQGLDTTISSERIKLDSANAAILIEASRIDNLTGRTTAAEIAIDGANGAILLKASQTAMDALTGTVATKAAQIDLDSANAAIALRATSTDLTAAILVQSNLIGMSLTSPGATYTPGMTLTWSDASHTKSLLRVSTDSFQVGNIVSTVYSGTRAYLVDELVTYSGNTYRCKLASTGNVPTNTTYWVLATGLNYRPVFSVGNVNGISAVGISGNLFIDGTVSANSLVADSAMITFLNAGNIVAGSVAADWVYAGEIDAGNITSGVITGRTLQTASSGERFVVDASSKAAHFYDSTGAEKVWIGTALSGALASYAVFGDLTDPKTGIVALTDSNAGVVGRANTGVGVVGTTVSGYGVTGSGEWNGSSYTGTGVAGSNAAIGVFASGSEYCLTTGGGVFTKGAILLGGKNTHPSSPDEGSIYFNRTDKHFYGFNGTSWKIMDN